MSARAMVWPGTLVARLVAAAGRRLPWRTAWPALVAVLVGAAVVFGRGHHGPLGVAATLPLAVAATAPLLLVRRWPLCALGTVVTANAIYVTAARLSWPATAVVGWLLAMTVCPQLLRRSRAVALLVVSELAVAVAVFVPASLNATPWDASMAEASAVLLAWGAGEYLRSRRETGAHRAEVAAQLRGLRERDALARSRAGVARDLHDVVAHHVSLIAVRAATAPYQVVDLSPAAREAFGEIAAQARTALDELRAVLGVLRTGEGAPPQSPQPMLADLPGLLDRMRSNGMQISTRTTGTPRPLPESAELCCYRVVQEALTNVARHAAGARIIVELIYGCDDIAVLVRDSGGTDGPPRAAGDAGFGLVGMTERVTALGGEVQAGPDGPGFRVAARIPATASPQTPP